MSRRTDPKAERLLRIAQKTLLKGDRNTAREIAVMALTTEDAVQALDRLLPHVPEPDPEALDLSSEQVAKIISCAREMENADQTQRKIACQILSKIERMETRKKLKRAK